MPTPLRLSISLFAACLALGASSQALAQQEIPQGTQAQSDVALTTKIFDALAVSFSFSNRYESKPVPGKEKLDTISAVSLVYTFL